MAGIAITRREFTASELRAAAGRSKDARGARRMLAIALVREGVDRTTAAQTFGVRRIRELSGGQFPRRTRARRSAGNPDPHPGPARHPTPRHPLSMGIRPPSRTGGVRGLTDTNGPYSQPVATFTGR